MLTPFARDNPVRRFPIIVAALILANAGIFFAFIGDHATYRNVVDVYGLTPNVHTALSFITHMFLHGGLSHLFWNMFFFFIFGPNVEDLMGRIAFPVFYLICGVVAGAMHMLWELGGPGAGIPLVGASGALSGVLGAYFILFPKSTIRAFFIIFPVRIHAFWFIIIWFASQVTSLGDNSSGIAFMAHIGGFVFGAGSLFLLMKMNIVVVPNYELVQRGRYAVTTKHGGLLDRLEEAYRTGDFKMVSYSYAAMLEEAPQTYFDPSVHMKLGAAMIAAGRPDLAIASYRRIMEVHHNSIEACAAAIEISRIAAHYYNDLDSASGYLQWVLQNANPESIHYRAAHNDYYAIQRMQGGLF